MLSLLAYLADAIILLTYALTATGRWRSVTFHLANALGCFPIIAIEVVAGAWPALVLTAAFGIIGWVGVLKA